MSFKLALMVQREPPPPHRFRLSCSPYSGQEEGNLSLSQRETTQTFELLEKNSIEMKEEWTEIGGGEVSDS